MNYYVDTSHLVSILGFSLELTDPATLRLAVELCEYGKKLSPMFHYRGDPPFEDIYADHGIFLKTLLGEDVETGIAHFRRKVEATDPAGDRNRPRADSGHPVGPTQTLSGSGWKYRCSTSLTWNIANWHAHLCSSFVIWPKIGIN